MTASENEPPDYAGQIRAYATHDLAQIRSWRLGGQTGLLKYLESSFEIDPEPNGHNRRLKTFLSPRFRMLGRDLRRAVIEEFYTCSPSQFTNAHIEHIKHDFAFAEWVEAPVERFALSGDRPTVQPLSMTIQHDVTDDDSDIVDGVMEERLRGFEQAVGLAARTRKVGHLDVALKFLTTWFAIDRWTRSGFVQALRTPLFRQLSAELRGKAVLELALALSFTPDSTLAGRVIEAYLVTEWTDGRIQRYRRGDPRAVEGWAFVPLAELRLGLPDVSARDSDRSSSSLGRHKRGWTRSGDAVLGRSRARFERHQIDPSLPRSASDERGAGRVPSGDDLCLGDTPHRQEIGIGRG